MKAEERKNKRPNLYIIGELLALFVILPLLYLFNLPFHKIIPLIVLFIYCLVILILNRGVRFASFDLKAGWPRIIFIYLVIIFLLAFLIQFFMPNQLLADLSTNRKLLYMIIVYPVFSAFPQELIFREFFFYRYNSIFRSKATLMISNVLLFAFAHVYFANWIVIAFTLVGGLLFSITYFKTKSLLVVTIEHTLYGLTILSSGLSDYFYKAF